MPPRVVPVESSLVLVRMLRSLRSRNSSLTLPSSRYRRKIDRTSSASSSTMAILPSFISYPRGRLPPTQRPLRLDAAILSRIRSEVTSRSNWAKDSCQQVVGLVAYDDAVGPLGERFLPDCLKQPAVHDRWLLAGQDLILVFDLADIEVIAQQVIQSAAPEQDAAARRPRGEPPGFGPDVAVSEVA